MLPEKEGRKGGGGEGGKRGKETVFMKYPVKLCRPMEFVQAKGFAPVLS